ncbi:hypothetical protein MBLNU459_g6504t1 [Dothideomycetes sp. NU459]
MARKGPHASDEKDESALSNLRKKPIRRATTKATAVLANDTSKTPNAAPKPASKPAPKPAPKSRATRNTVTEEVVVVAAQPLSPKKITQVARARIPDEPVQEKKTALLAAPSRKDARPRRPARSVSGKPTVTAPIARARSVRTAESKALTRAPAQPPVQEDQEERSEEKDREEQYLEGKEQAEHTEDEQSDPDVGAKDVQDECTSVSPISVKPLPTRPSKHKLDNFEPSKDESDDELCGPKTPMRRGLTPSRTRAVQPLGSVPRHLHTPARRPVHSSARHHVPQTQQLPIRRQACISPRRPMTALRSTSRTHTSPTFIHAVTEQITSPKQSVFGENDSCKDKASLDFTDVVNKSIQKDERSAYFADDDCSEDVLDEEEPQHDAVVERREAFGTKSESFNFTETEAQCIRLDHGSPSYHDTGSRDEIDSDSEDELQHISDDEDTREESLQDQEDLANESDYEVEQENPPTDDDTSCDDDSELEYDEDKTIVESHLPHLPDELFQSSPPQPAPRFSNNTEINLDTSEMASSSPSTPVSATAGYLEDDESASDEPAPAARVSLFDNSIFSEVEDQDDTTVWRHRVSFNTASARMLQTPNMRAFRGPENPSADSSPTGNQVSVADEVYIDPALLAEQNIMLGLAQEADALAKTTSADQFVEFSSSVRETIPLRSYLPDPDTPRMSLLEESILIEPADHDFASSAITGENSPKQVVIAATMAGRYPASQTVMASPEVDLDRTTLDGAGESTKALPSYARPTVATESRRKSMQNFGNATPQHTSTLPQTAETTVKPVSGDAFASLLASKGKRPSMHRSISSISQKSSPRTSGSWTPTIEHKQTLSVRKRDETPLQHKSTLLIHEQPMTPMIHFAGPKPRKHTPTSIARAPQRSQTPQPLKTPVKTPLKAPGATPGPYPMTPHPQQPLQSVTALVEVFTLDGSSASGPFIALLHRLGARTTKTWSERVTHVVFKDGSPATLQKVRLANKDAAAGTGKELFCVNSRWVTDCDREGRKQDERSAEYAVDVSDVPRAGRRRRKSMEPSTLRNVDGNVVAAAAAATPKSRRHGFGRKDLARVSLASTAWGSSPVKGGGGDGSGGADRTPLTGATFDTPVGDEENWFDEGPSEVAVATPDTLQSERDSLHLQQTAPVHRMKKLRTKRDGGRRLTFFPHKTDL